MTNTTEVKNWLKVVNGEPKIEQIGETMVVVLSGALDKTFSCFNPNGEVFSWLVGEPGRMMKFMGNTDLIDQELRSLIAGMAVGQSAEAGLIVVDSQAIWERDMRRWANPVPTGLSGIWILV